jgi:hypothetical protein
MVESRWLRRLVPVVAVFGSVVAAVSTTTGAPPAAWIPPACAGPPGPGPGGIGAWYRLDPVITDGVRTGQRLTVGRAATDAPASIDLGPESFASGPFGGTVLAGTDDGRSSRLSLVDLAAGCAWAVAEAVDVVRHAAIAPDGRSIVEFRVDRRTRADLGVWARPLDGAPPGRVLGPLESDPRFGPTWLTELSWSDDGRTLVVESCGEVACRFRLVDPTTGDSSLVADPLLGGLVGVAEERIIARGACRGLPCPVVSVDRGGGRPVILADAAGQAVLATDEAGRAVVVHERDVDGRVVSAVRPDGTDARPIPVAVDDRRLVGPAAWAGGAVDHPPGWVVFGPDGRLPVAEGQSAVLRRIPDGRTVTIDEVLR